MAAGASPAAETTVAPVPSDDYTQPSLPNIAPEFASAGLDHTTPHEALVERIDVEPAVLVPELPVESFEPEIEPIHVDDADADFDADIAAIFGEEATELLEQSDAAFSRWRRDRADGNQVTELKRLLHTLKGGARMAGLRAMGDISHELESLLAAVEVGSVDADTAAFDVLQESLDELHRMREMANFGQRILAPASLLDRIRGLALQRREQVEAIADPDTSAPATFPSVFRWRLSGAEPPAAVDQPTADVQPGPGFTATDETQTQAVEPVDADPFSPPPPVDEHAERVRGAHRRRTRSRVRGNFCWNLPRRQPNSSPCRPPRSCRRLRRSSRCRPRSGLTAPRPWISASANSKNCPRRWFPSNRRVACLCASRVPASAVQPVLPGREAVVTAERQEMARVDAELLDDLLNNAGEISIFRARIEQQMTQMEFNLVELDRTVTRLREQLRKMEMETEAQILFKHQQEDAHRADFDPLELDRYSTIQQLSRALAESVSDVGSIEGLLENLNRDTQNLLQQQGRIVTEVQKDSCARAWCRSSATCNA